MSDTGERIAGIVFFLRLAIGSRPTSLQIMGWLLLALTVMGLALNALPSRWAEWVREYIGLGTLAAISWGGWIFRRFKWRRPARKPVPIDQIPARGPFQTVSLPNRRKHTMANLI
jgi:hypothetical protein